MLDIIERQITEKGWLSLSTLYFDNAYSIDVYNTRGAVAYSKADQCFFALNGLDSTDTAIVEHKVAVYDNHHIGNQVNLTVSGEEHLQHYDIALYAHYRLLFNDMDSSIIKADEIPEIQIPTPDEVKALTMNEETGLFDGTDTVTMLGGNQVSTIGFYEKCGFARSHRVKNFFVDNYDHVIIEDGKQLVDMVYLKMSL